MRTTFYISAALLALFTVATAAVGQGAPASGASDLDAFMKQVLARRDDNWTKLQQYTLEEEQRLQVTAIDGRRAYGFRREYLWFPSDTGVFVRSPLRVDGVTVGEADRRKAEADWLKEEAEREKRRAERKATDDDPVTLDDVVNGKGEPRFISSAYFMKFKFDAGSYALVGREKLHGTEVLKVEYYPTRYFQDERTRDGERSANPRDREKEAAIDRKMDKVSLITLWIEPRAHQILQYEFSNVDWSFVPGQWLVRLDQVHASMEMAQPFPGVWLPGEIAMRFSAGTAIGDVAARYSVQYRDYKLADVKARVR